MKTTKTAKIPALKGINALSIQAIEQRVEFGRLGVWTRAEVLEACLVWLQPSERGCEMALRGYIIASVAA